MAPRKGVGNKKGKQPAQRRQVTQASPPHSSSDEESWPVWQRLQNKIEALEAQTLGKQPAQPRGVRRSARESKGHRSSRLRVMARDLTQRCAAIESTQGTDAASRQDEDGAGVAAKRRRTVEQRTVSREESAHASVSQEEQEDIEEVSYEAPPQDEEQDGPSTSYGEFAPGPFAQAAPPAWPWPAGAPGTYPQTTPYISMSPGLPNAPWPYATPHLTGWGAPAGAPPAQAQPTLTAGSGAWPYPSVPNTGYNTVPITALPYGDYSTPLGDHLSPATKEKI